MKNILKKGVLLISIIFLTGCMNYNLNMNINADQSVDLKLNLNIDMLKMFTNPLMMDSIKEEIFASDCEKECLNSTDSNCESTCLSNKNLTEQDIKNYLDKNMDSEDFTNNASDLTGEDLEQIEKAGFKVENNVDKENYQYNLTISKHFNNISEITTSEDLKVNLNDIFSQEDLKLFHQNGNNYQANFILEQEETETPELDADIDLSEVMTVTYTVTLPNPPISNNASKVSDDKKTLTWDLTKSLESINYEFNFNKSQAQTSFIDNITNIFTNFDTNTLKLISYSLIGGGVLVLIITIIIYNKKKKAE